MPLLNQLSSEMKDALGKVGALSTQYEILAEKSKSESLRDNPDAIKYVDSVVKDISQLKQPLLILQSYKVKKTLIFPC